MAVVSNRRGLSFIELIITVVILSVLGMLVLPLTQMTAKRVKELRLRQNLREIRTAIDKYKDDKDFLLKQGKAPPTNINDTGYPKTLDVLLMGEPDPTDPTGKRIKKYLRIIPRDPFNSYKESDPEKMWHLGCNKDKRGDDWCKDDVFDVYSLSDETAIDGTIYKDW